MNNELSTEMMLADDGAMMIADLTNRKRSYCSFNPDTEEGQIKLFNAMNNPDERLADHINEIISVKDVFVEAVECVRPETGETETCPRIVLISEDGTSFQAVSRGVFGAISKLFQVFGEPHTWTSAKHIKVKQVTKGEKKLLTLELTTADATATKSKK